MGRVTHKFTIEHPRYGIITVTPRRCSRNITVRRRQSGEITASVPFGAYSELCEDSIMRLVEQLDTRRGAVPNRTFFDPGSEIECRFGVKFVIERSQRVGDRCISARASGRVVTVICGNGVDLTSGQVAKSISDLMVRAAGGLAGCDLIGRGRELATRLGVQVAGWRIGRGRNILGTCRADGIITLSAVLLFLPEELVDYVVCHELAHLRYHNHSDSFHSLCNEYCGGRERELATALRRYKWPILR